MAKRDFLKRLGPGIVTGAADDDPSGIGTYTSVGATAGYGFLWSAVWLLPFAYVVQESCARLAFVTGKGLAAVIKSRMPSWVLVLAVLLVSIANTVNIAANLSIMSAALGLIAPIETWLGVVLFAVLLGFTEIVIPYHKYAKVLRWLCLSLLAYVAVLFVAQVDWQKVLVSTLIPSFDFSRISFELLIALAGTTISPYLFFWQAAEEVEEQRTLGRGEIRPGQLTAMRGDVFSGMFTGVFIMFSIMATSAATLHAQGITQVNSAADAALALKPIAGEFASLLFLLGILGVGLLSIPVLAGSTAYAVAETFGWRESLELKPRQAKAFYGVIVLSMAVALLLNLAGIEPVNFLLIAATLNGLTAPILMAIIWWLARDKKLLGIWASGKVSQFLLGFATLAMGSLPLFWLMAK
ncbi:MAG: divalent metal cation transporter [Actinobacteria bacterium]|nr:divalent metal cation transporter [Actinomycetota bacterium]